MCQIFLAANASRAFAQRDIPVPLPARRRPSRARLSERRPRTYVPFTSCHIIYSRMLGRVVGRCSLDTAHKAVGPVYYVVVGLLFLGSNKL